MMTALAIAHAEYQKILRETLESCSDTAESFRPSGGGRLFEVLEVSVVPAVIPLLSQRWFREIATWHARVLTPGCHSSEFAKLEATKEALHQLLESLTDAFKGLRANQVTKLQEPPSSENFRLAGVRTLPIFFTKGDQGFRPVASTEPVTSPALNLSAREIHSQIDNLLAEIDQSLQKPLVDPADYFGPCRGTRTAGGGLVRWEFLADFSDSLKRGGSFIARCVDIRLLGILDQLQAVAEMLDGALPKAKPRPWTTLFEPARSKIAALREALFSTSDAQTASAAAFLVQMVVEIATQTNEVWLPIQFDCRNSADPFHSLLKSRGDIAFARRIESALRMCVQIITNRPEREKVILEAVEKGGLVVVCEPRGVFWKGVEVCVDWECQTIFWKLITSLAQSRGVGYVGMREVYGDDEKLPGALTTSMSRLKSVLPDSLAALIRSNKGESQYSIKLPSSAIIFIDKSVSH